MRKRRRRVCTMLVATTGPCHGDCWAPKSRPSPFHFRTTNKKSLQSLQVVLSLHSYMVVGSIPLRCIFVVVTFCDLSSVRTFTPFTTHFWTKTWKQMSFMFIVKRETRSSRDLALGKGTKRIFGPETWDVILHLKAGICRWRIFEELT